MYEERVREIAGIATDQATSELWAEATRRVRLIARKGFRRTLAISDLEDVEQAVIMKLLDVHVLLTAAGSSSPGVYIARMIRNAALDHMRRRAHDFTSNAESLTENISESTHDFDNAHTRSRFDQLATSLEALSPSDRELLNQKFWNDLSIEEISAHMALPYSTVAKRLFRAVSRLRARMELEVSHA
ncbi:MAG: sigma-70 family RNA polymerase sigma factor [Acidobacteriota bacterium]|nr:sigma-70 family RNA polymerase sigma factor [Acidobacteriota bacterium]